MCVSLRLPGPSLTACRHSLAKMEAECVDGGDGDDGGGAETPLEH